LQKFCSKKCLNKSLAERARIKRRLKKAGKPV
jgi:hypothetical protein